MAQLHAPAAVRVLHTSLPLSLSLPPPVSRKYGKRLSEVSRKMRINALALGEDREPLNAARAKLVSMWYLSPCLSLPHSLSHFFSGDFRKAPSNGCKCRHKPKAPRAGPVRSVESVVESLDCRLPRSGNGTIIATKSKQPTEDVKQQQLNCTGILPKDITRIPLIHEDLHYYIALAAAATATAAASSSRLTVVHNSPE